jgi:P pilus assembly chaperone PapD
MMRFGLLFSLLFYAANAVTGVMPEKSRIVYHQQSKMQSSVLVNTNDYPVMVQLWIDDGELQKPPELATAPFVVTPAVFKLNARQLNGIKVIYSGEKGQLPSDRESLFWFEYLRGTAETGN